MQAAIQKNGFEKLKRIVKSLTGSGHIHTLLFHWFGNYTLQDLVAASSKLRTAAVAALHKAQVQTPRSTSSEVGFVRLLADVRGKVLTDRTIDWSVAILLSKGIDPCLQRIVHS